MLGFLLIDKPKGISSFDCIRKLRKLFNMRCMGFVGTLDPLATGLLLFGLGEATKLIPYLEGTDKTYETGVHFGATSNTYDGEGKIVDFPAPREPSRRQIEEILEEEFLGEREQVPPQFSAIQIDGKRAYAMARKNETIELKPRKVSFYDIALKSYKWPSARFVVRCGSGTYIRSFAHDLGQKLGCGGYIEELRRTKIGPYSVKNAVKLDDLTSKNVVSYVLKPEEMFHDWVHVQLNKERFYLLWHGGFVENFAHLKSGPALAMYKNDCIGTLELHASGQLKLARRFNNE